jgi:predicted TIM-barrel fold metal-dependent hydrolase
MQVFDFNIHLPSVFHEDVNVVIADDLSLSAENVIKGFELHLPAFKNVQGANFLLFNTNLFDQNFNLLHFKSIVQSKLSHSSFTALIDFRRTDLFEYLERVVSSGVNAIMFNSYLQQIAEQDFTLIYRVCKFVEEHGLIICIDTSYGTSKMYAYDNLKLACFISELITKSPIVLIHSGGYRILEAMLLVLDKKNIYLDTSFSLPYYIGSSLETDYAFAYRKIGYHKILFGSDHPYLNYSSALETHLSFFAKHKFSSTEIDAILFDNAIRLIEHA